MRWPWRKRSRSTHRPRLELRVGRVGSNCRVLLDGEDVSHWFTAFNVSAAVGDLTKVELTLLPAYVRILLEDRTLRSLSMVSTGEDGVTREQTQLVPEPGAEAIAAHLEEQGWREVEEALATPTREESPPETGVRP